MGPWASIYMHQAVRWWRHEMETFSALLVLCEGNSPVSGRFPSQRPVTRSFDVSFDVRPNKRLSKQSKCRGSEAPSHSLWRHHNETLHHQISCNLGDARYRLRVQPFSNLTSVSAVWWHTSGTSFGPPILRLHDFTRYGGTVKPLI